MQRLAVVTGGTRGLGLAISRRLAREGLSVVMLYRKDEAAAEAALAEVPGGRAERVDVSDETEVEAFAARLGPAEVLVHSALRSGRPAAKTHELSPAAWREDLAVNLTGPFLVTRALIPGMLARGFGRVVFIGSLAMRGERGRVAYTVAKNGLVGLARTIAHEYARSGITANVVSPGFIEAGAFLRLDDKIREAAAAQVPMKRLGDPEEVAAAVWYLCGPGSGYTTGQVLEVDGGTR